MNILYFDCFSGAAGDMILGALLDAGAPESSVREQLAALDVGGWDFRTVSTTMGGLRATRAEVTVADGTTPRSYPDIRSVVDGAALSEPVKSRALAIFETLAGAEARVHDVEPDDVHLHEIGSVDSIIDIVGSSAALEHFMPARVVTSALPTGAGSVETAHGTLPVLAPAVVEILAARGMPILGRGSGELVTPTGAAILATITDHFGPAPAMVLERVGHGAGTRPGEMPNVLRVLLGTGERGDAETALLIETNIDDMSPELVPYVIERLLDAGAQDAWATPIVMKKGRPAVTLSVLAGPANIDSLKAVIFRETPTFGVRISTMSKDVLERSAVEANVQGFAVRVKLGRRGGEIVTAAPEYEDAVAVARATGLPLRRVYEIALEAALARS